MNKDSIYTLTVEAQKAMMMRKIEDAAKSGRYYAHPEEGVFLLPETIDFFERNGFQYRQTEFLMNRYTITWNER